MRGVPDFEGWATFAKVAQRLSFAGAAEDLGVTGATASKSLARLEARLGVTLVQRTTRRLALTPIGRELAAGAEAFLAAARALEDDAASGSATPAGLVRMAAPVSFGITHLIPILPVLVDTHPGIRLDLTLDDGLTDLVLEGMDLAVRVGWPRDSRLKSRRIGEVETPVVAAPSYLGRWGTPRSPEDLRDHETLTYANLPSRDRWTMTGPGGEERTVEVANLLVTNSGEAMRSMLIAGRGIAMMPRFLVGGDLRDGTLREVLPGWGYRVAGVFLLLPTSGPRPARVAAVADFLEETLSRRSRTD